MPKAVKKSANKPNKTVRKLSKKTAGKKPFAAKTDKKMSTPVVRRKAPKHIKRVVEQMEELPNTVDTSADNVSLISPVVVDGVVIMTPDTDDYR